MIQDVERTTGKPVVLRAERGLEGRAHATYSASDPDQSRHLILYQPGFEAYLNHLVPHELGHVQLFAAARPPERLLPHVGATERRVSRTVIDQGLSPLTRRLVGDGKESNGLFDLWSDGVTSQLGNYPQDILIERTIFEHRPGLRSSQRESLALLAKEAHAGLDARVLLLTPRVVAVASHSMNYALLKSCARFLQEPWMVRPYRGTLYERMGEELLGALAEQRPADLSGCIAVSRDWAGRLGVAEWFFWGLAHQPERRAGHFWEE
ncbi:MAG: hypothetical protein ACKVT1_08565 [Dehalococcoidia bacterium]